MAVGDSSPFSAESNFRELDDVFLQTQARIWIGEVLQNRLDENPNISDLLADGELLFEVSGVVRRMLLTRYMELRNIKAYKFEQLASRKSSRRYMPYSNVDSFVKICKILGLTGIDLFSPSDVVEKRNTRKVCMCIRSLSKKARSKQLNVPDFDMVTCTVAMPTDMVGCIRRSLEQSQHNFLSNANLNSNQGLMANFKKKNSTEAYGRKLDMCSEESDDSDCNFMIQTAGSSLTCSYDASSQINFDIKDSPGVSSVIEKKSPDPHFSPLEKSTGQFDSLCENESSRHSCLLLEEDNYRWDGLLSSICADSLILLSDSVSGVKNIGCDYENGTFDDLDLQNGVLKGSVGSSKQERSDVINQLSTSNMIFQETDTDRIQFNGYNNSFGGHRSPSSHGSNSTPRSVEDEFRSKFFYVNNLEVSSTADISPASGVVQNLDFDDQLDAGYNMKTVSLSELQDKRALLLCNKPENIVKYKTLVHYSSSITTKQPPVDMEDKDVGSSTRLLLPSSDSQSCTTNYSDQGVLCDRRISMSLESNVGCDEGKNSQNESNVLKDVHCNQSLQLIPGKSCSPFDFHLWDQKGKCAVPKISSEHDGNNDHGISAESVSQENIAVDVASCYRAVVKISSERDGNNGHGISTESVPQKCLAVDIASWYPAKDAVDALVEKKVKSDVIDKDKEGLNATALESDHKSNHFQTIHSNLISDVAYKNLNASTELWSTDEDSALQHQDIMIQHSSGQNRNIPGRTSTHHPSVCHNVVYPPTEPVKDIHSCSTTECEKNLGSKSSQVCMDLKNDSSCADNMSKMNIEDNGKNEEVEILAVEKSHTTDYSGVAEHRPYRKLLLKSVMRGTAVFGVLFLFLHLRKSSREATSGESEMHLGKTKKEKTIKLSWQKQQSQKESRVNGVYPANKLGFGA